MKNNKKKILLRIVFLSMFLVFSTIYIYMPERKELAAALGFITDLENLSLNSLSDSIVLAESYPISDYAAYDADSTLFEVTNSSNKNTEYKLYLKPYRPNPDVKYLDLSNLRYSISVDGKEYSEPKNVPDDGILMINNIPANSKQLYSLKLWIDYDVDNTIYGSTFSATLFVEK